MAIYRERIKRASRRDWLHGSQVSKSRPGAPISLFPTLIGDDGRLQILRLPRISCRELPLTKLTKGDWVSIWHRLNGSQISKPFDFVTRCTPDRVYPVIPFRAKLSASVTKRWVPQVSILRPGIRATNLPWKHHYPSSFRGKGSYSVRNARMGSTEAALLAGMSPASAATKTTTVMAIAYTFASVDETLKSWLRNARVAMMEMGIVTAMAMPARTRTSRRIRRTTAHRWAPRAMR